MKKYLLIFITTICLFACNTPYYRSINNMYGQPATITLANGKELSGKISINSFNDYASINRLGFAEGVSNAYVNYFIKDIERIYVNGSYFYPKILISDNFINGSETLRFMKLISSENGKMKMFLYESERKQNVTNGNKSSVAITNLVLKYFVGLPSAQNNEVFDIESKTFLPNFDEKMSLYVKDCPELANKIRAKDKNYFYPAFSDPNDRKVRMLNIINEYNNCR